MVNGKGQNKDAKIPDNVPDNTLLLFITVQNNEGNDKSISHFTVGPICPGYNKILQSNLDKDNVATDGVKVTLYCGSGGDEAWINVIPDHDVVKNY